MQNLETEWFVVLEYLQEPRVVLPGVLGANGDWGVQQGALVLQGILHRWVTRGRVTLKGQSNEICYSHFFHHLNLLGPLTNRLKHFRFWLRFRRVIQIFLILPGVSYPGEPISSGYHTRRVIWLFWFLIKGSVQQNVQPVFFIIQGCLGHWVMGQNIFYFGYDFSEFFEFFFKISPVSQSPQGIIPRGINCQFLNCLHRPLKG